MSKSRRLMTILLPMAIVLSIGVQTFANDTDLNPKTCPAHPFHTADCGYTEVEVVLQECSFIANPVEAVTTVTAVTTPETTTAAAETSGVAPAVSGSESAVTTVTTTAETTTFETTTAETTTPAVTTAHTHDAACGYKVEMQMLTPCTHSCVICNPTISTSQLANLSLTAQVEQSAGKTRTYDAFYDKPLPKGRSGNAFHSTLGQSVRNPFIISRLDQLKELAELIAADGTYSVNANGTNQTYYFAQSYYLLVADIDARAMHPTTIGESQKPFAGVFDGNNHVILYTSGGFSALFPDAKAGSVENLTVTLPTVTTPTADKSWYTNDPSATSFTISTEVQLIGLADIVNSDGHNFSGETIFLANDLDMSSINTFTPIGSTSSKFAGTFDGKGHVIKNITIASTPGDAGLFGYADGATIKNLGVLDCSISTTGSYNAGAIAGYIASGTIENCFSTGAVTGGKNAGGIVGDSIGTITNCYSTANVTGAGAAAGGIVGNTSAEVKGCFAAGNISGKLAGGVVGNSSASVTDCVALNRSVKATGANATDVARVAITTGTLSNLIARDDMTVSYNTNTASTITSSSVGKDGESKSIKALLNGSQWNGFSPTIWEFKQGYLPNLKNFSGPQPTYSLKDITAQLVPVHMTYSDPAKPFQGVMARSKDNGAWYVADADGVVNLVPGKYDIIVKLTYKDILNKEAENVVTILEDYELDENSGTASKPMHFWLINFAVGQGNYQTPPTMVLDGELLKRPESALEPKNTNGSLDFSGWFESVGGPIFSFSDKKITKNWIIHADYGTFGGSYGGNAGDDDSTKTVAANHNHLNVVTSQYKSNAHDTMDSAITNVDMQVDKAGMASFTISSNRAECSINGLKNAISANSSKAGGSIHKSIEYNMKTADSKTEVTGVKAIITNSSLKMFANYGIESLVLRSGMVTISLDGAMIDKLLETFSGQVCVEAQIIKPENMPESAKKIFGNNPAYDFSIYNGAQELTDFGSGTVNIALPYLNTGKNSTGSIMIANYDPAKEEGRYLMSSGYNSTTKRAQGLTDSFSIYGVTLRKDLPNMVDVSGHWAKERIEFAVNRDIIAPLSNNNFAPNSPLTQDVLAEALTKMNSTDVDYSGLITSGQISNTATVTREALAGILVDYMSKRGISPLKIREEMKFFDMDKLADPNSFSDIKAVQTAGIMVGRSGNLFDPQAAVTRAEFASIAYRLVNVAVDSKFADGLDINDSGKYICYESGLMVKGTTKRVGEFYYTFDKNGLISKVSATYSK